MGCTVLYQAAVDAVSGPGSAATDVGGVDVEDLQRWALTTRIESNGWYGED